MSPLVLSRRTARLEEAWRQSLDPLIQQGKADGARIASGLDSDYGTTRPTLLVLIDRLAAAVAAGLLPDFRSASTRDERKLHRLGPSLVRIRAEEASAKAAVQAARAADGRSRRPLDQVDGALVRTSTRWFGLGLLLCLGIADIGLAEAVLELLGLSTLVTWMVAASLGIGQLAALHMLGELHARRTVQSEHEGRSLGPASLVLALAFPALALALLLAWLRAEYLSLELSQAGVSGGIVNFWLAMATFAAIQLLLDGLAFAIGHRFRTSTKRERLEHTQRRWARRLARAESRFGRAMTTAMGRCEVTDELVDKVFVDHRAQSAAAYLGITTASDRETAAAFSEPGQLSGIDEEAMQVIRALHDAASRRRTELIGIAQTYGHDTLAATFVTKASKQELMVLSSNGKRRRQLRANDRRSA